MLRQYKKLLKRYGKQNWWPAESDFEVVVGALLTQNTNWKNVEKAILNLKSKGKLTPNLILNLKKEELAELIRPAGYYNQKAERLGLLTKAHLKAKSSWNILKLREHFLSVKGVGKETADSILLYGFHKPIFVIDAYTRRFCKHYSIFEAKEYDEYRLFFESNLPKDVNLYKEYHALIVAWGKENK
ncbi:endonuclease [Candidatus Micrarchaeota archaeon]|nr:endonuclease [Candidatus Micrarchaeota archaeon]